MTLPFQDELPTSPDSSWSEFIRLNEHTSSNSVVDATSVAINTIVQSRLLPLYNMRTIAYMTSRQYENATNDAANMVRLAPHAAQGYICMGELYMMQGRSEAATGILTDGLSKVSDVDPDYYQLRSYFRIATNKLERHVDYIAKLPLEVLGEILRYLQIDQLLTLLQVSKTWRTRILGYPKAWTNIRTDTLNTRQVNQLCSLLPVISNYIECTDLDITLKDLFLIFTAQAKSGQLGKLKTLYLHYFNGKNCYMHSDKLLDVIPATENRLVDFCLTASNPYYDMQPFLFELLKRCSNLKDLTFCRPCMFLTHPATDLPITSHGLSSLDLTCSHLNVRMLESVLRLCTHLRSLYLKVEKCESIGSEVLEIVRTYGKELEILDLNSFEGPYEQQEGSNNPIGLRSLQVGPEFTLLAPLASLLHDHRTTLEKLAFPLSEHLNYDVDINESTSAILRGHSFPVLRQLYVTVVPGTENAISEMIRQSNKLEELSIDFSTAELAYPVLTAIATSPTNHLEHIHYLEMRSIDGDDGLKSIFKAFNSLGTRSSLREVVLYEFNIPPSSNVLVLWAGLQHICSIALYNSHVTKLQIDALEQKCKESRITLLTTDIIKL